MTKEIKYNGYTANTSDYQSPDGDLALSLGLIQEDGTLRPLLPPSVVMQLESGAVVKCIHKTTTFTHYIILKDDNALQWCGTNAEETQVTFHTFTSEIHQISTIGNTLVVLANDGMHYFLWKADSNSYAYLGSDIPELPLSFGLQGEYVWEDSFKVYFADKIDYIFEKSGGAAYTETTANDPFCKEFTDDNKKAVTEAVLAKVNKFIAEHATNKGRFIYPFFVRYAYRLYDGTLTKHSAPILMVCSSDSAPEVFALKVEYEDDDKEGYDNHTYWKTKAKTCDMRVDGVLHKLDYAVVEQKFIDDLKKWSDIIRSVDIFISKPIYTYDQNGECQKFERVNDSDSYTICKLTNQSTPVDKFPNQYQYHPIHQLYALRFDNFETVPRYRVQIPKRSVDDVKSDIKSCAQFYLLESIKLEHLSTDRTLINVEDEYLQSLVNREVMTDDYDSHDKIVAKKVFGYNNRLNLTDISKRIFKGFNAYSMLPYTDGYCDIEHYLNNMPNIDNTTHQLDVYYFIKHEGQEIVVKGDSGQIALYAPVLFLYYPSVEAYKAVVCLQTNATAVEIPLEQHDFLNGSFYFGGWDDLFKVYQHTNPSFYQNESSDVERTICLPNKIYTSEINNPFVFPVLGINTVGTGDIIGISTAAKALSEGQFGQFPLYAFTTEGVWALEVSNTGTYSAKQPITRDVVISSESITQIDSAVLFATDRGIMLISGSQTQCISDIINDDNITPNSSLLIPHSSLIDIFNSKADEREQITLDNVTLLSFKEFLKSCRMVYDYTNQHIIVYNKEVQYAYVFSLKSKQWGMMCSDIVEGVNSYPEALAMTKDNKLVNFSTPDTTHSTPHSALIITRPVKLDDPTVFKTVNTVIQRGMFRSTHVRQVLYGSNDFIHWHVVWSSVDKIMRGFRGTPYKAYRLAVVCHFDKGESIDGCTMVYEPRMTNQVR